MELPPALSRKLDQIRDRLRELGSCVIALSGGADSTLLAHLAHEELGDRALAVTGISPSVSARERDDARRFAQTLGIPHREIPTEELEDPDYVANRGDRCYYCRRDLYGRMRRVAQEEGRACVLDGALADDDAGDRPGMRAAREADVVSLLRDVGCTKADVLAISQSLGLPSAGKAEMACLASRIPAGRPVTREALAQAEAAEEVLRQAGFPRCRVRHHGDRASIEAPPDDMPRIVASPLRGDLVRRIRECGFASVSLDLVGKWGTSS